MVALAGPIAPTKHDMKLARESTRVLSAHARTGLRIQVANHPALPMVELPAPAADLLIRILSEMAAGNPVHVIPINSELTTRGAADFLNVSRPFVSALLKNGEISSRLAGTHRKVNLKSLLEFKKRSDAKRAKTLRALVRQGQQLKM